jgi:hypothetical protein
MVDRAAALVGRLLVHIAVGAPSAGPPAVGSGSGFVMASTQPVRLAYRVLLLLAAGLGSGTAWAQQPTET